MSVTDALVRCTIGKVALGSGPLRMVGFVVRHLGSPFSAETSK
jgi:hypothetical protein